MRQIGGFIHRFLCLSQSIFPSLTGSIHLHWNWSVHCSRQLSGSHIAPFLMIKEVICRLKLHPSLSLYKVSITVQHFLSNNSTVDQIQYKHGSMTQWPLFKVKRTEFRGKPQIYIRIERILSWISFDITFLLWFTFDISGLKRLFKFFFLNVNLASYLQAIRRHGPTKERRMDGDIQQLFVSLLPGCVAQLRVPALSIRDGLIDNATQAKDLPPTNIQHV